MQVNTMSLVSSTLPHANGFKYKIMACIFFINLCSCTVHLYCLALRQAYRVVYKAIIVSLVLCFVGLEDCNKITVLAEFSG